MNPGADIHSSETLYKSILARKGESERSGQVGVDAGPGVKPETRDARGDIIGVISRGGGMIVPARIIDTGQREQIAAAAGQWEDKLGVQIQHQGVTAVAAEYIFRRRSQPQQTVEAVGKLYSGQRFPVPGIVTGSDSQSFLSAEVVCGCRHASGNYPRRKQGDNPSSKNHRR